jgi:SAM-dependent methyltransferase
VNNIRLSFYYQHVLGQIPAQPASDQRRAQILEVIARFIQPLGLDTNSQIQDLGSNTGYFLDRMRELGYTNTQGVEPQAADVNQCRSRGHRVRHGNYYLLPESDESQDLLFARDIMSLDPCPTITLLEYNRVLRPRAWLYIEVPRPDQDPAVENQRGQVSVLGRGQWLSLLTRAGFDVQWHELEWSSQDRRYAFVCQRRRPVDVK